MKNLILVIVVLALVAGGLYFYTNKYQKPASDVTNTAESDNGVTVEPIVAEDLNSTANDAGMEVGGY